jgi:hypothetical protein
MESKPRINHPSGFVAVSAQRRASIRESAQRRYPHIGAATTPDSYAWRIASTNQLRSGITDHFRRDCRS